MICAFCWRPLGVRYDRLLIGGLIRNVCAENDINGCRP